MASHGKCRSRCTIIHFIWCNSNNSIAFTTKLHSVNVQLDGMQFDLNLVQDNRASALTVRLHCVLLSSNSIYWVCVPQASAISKLDQFRVEQIFFDQSAYNIDDKAFRWEAVHVVQQVQRNFLWKRTKILCEHDLERFELIAGCNNNNNMI